jgi:hypothetical protein
LVKAGAKYTTPRPSDWYTPLHIACSKQFYNIIKYLIEIGVNVNYQDNFGNTPLHRLFSGAIKIEEKTTIGSLIPRPKKKDSVNTKKWIEENHPELLI